MGLLKTVLLAVVFLIQPVTSQAINGCVGCGSIGVGPIEFPPIGVCTYACGPPTTCDSSVKGSTCGSPTPTSTSSFVCEAPSTTAPVTSPPVPCTSDAAMVSSCQSAGATWDSKACCCSGSVTIVPSNVDNCGDQRISEETCPYRNDYEMIQRCKDSGASWDGISCCCRSGPNGEIPPSDVISCSDSGK